MILSKLIKATRKKNDVDRSRIEFKLTVFRLVAFFQKPSATGGGCPDWLRMGFAKESSFFLT